MLGIILINIYNLYSYSNFVVKGGENMKNKVSLKKISKLQNYPLRIFGCHCGCTSKVPLAFSFGYMGNYL